MTQLISGHPLRSMLRDWLKEEIEGREVIETQAVVTAAVAKFGTDPAFQAALLREALSELIPGMLRRLANEGREYIKSSDSYISHEQIARRAGTFWSRWYENIGGGVSKQLLALTKDELLHVAGEREKRADGEYRVAAFERHLAANMESGEIVSERYDEEDLGSIWDNYRTLTLTQGEIAWQQ